MNIQVRPAKAGDASSWILNRHYAKRMPPISYVFAAYIDGLVVGIITYGVPCSSTLRSGICGENNKSIVLELNRLVCDQIKNLPSTLISRSLKMIPGPRIIISYADTSMNHIGYIYQASNFIYTGLSAKRTDWKVKGKEHLHGATIADESRGQKNRAQWMRDKHGDDFYLEERPRKHRYIYFLGSKKEKAYLINSLRYEVKPYPKGESKKYNASGKTHSQGCLF